MPVEWAGSGRSCWCTIDRTARRACARSWRTAARGDPRRPPGRRRAAAVLARARRRPGPVPRPGPGLLRAAAGRGVPHQPARLGHPRRGAGAHRARPAPRRATGPARPRHAVADFRPGVPDLGLVPRDDWAWAIREACRTVPNTRLRLRRRRRAAAARGARRATCAASARSPPTPDQLSSAPAWPRRSAWCCTCSAGPRHAWSRSRTPGAGRRPSPSGRARPDDGSCRCRSTRTASTSRRCAQRRPRGRGHPGPPVAHRRRARRRGGRS